ncbi:MAG: metalloregulator ArsR/SmtB family transcription factor [Pseudohongiella sp.]|nr:metalloregulator ArsR/SmtB family transcription factor [Pseudohongiella sp.]
MHIEKTKVFSALSNEVRLRCVYLLATNEEICVCELVEALQINQPSASKALASLKGTGLVRDRRDANWIYYQLRSDLPSWLNEVINAVVDDLAGEKICKADERRFRRLATRPRELACP